MFSIPYYICRCSPDNFHITLLVLLTQCREFFEKSTHLTIADDSSAMAQQEGNIDDHSADWNGNDDDDHLYWMARFPQLQDPPAPQQQEYMPVTSAEAIYNQFVASPTMEGKQFTSHQGQSGTLGLVILHGRWMRRAWPPHCSSCCPTVAPTKKKEEVWPLHPTLIHAFTS